MVQCNYYGYWKDIQNWLIYNSQILQPTHQNLKQAEKTQKC